MEKTMQPIPFDPDTDIAPLPFEPGVLDLARRMKKQGLSWRPHTGCFVWDPDGRIAVGSPFPHRVYFILSLPRFVALMGSTETVAEALVWVPTWHQARVVAERLGVDHRRMEGLWKEGVLAPGAELAGLYRLLLERLGET
jgi:hypothetical protein